MYLPIPTEQTCARAWVAAASRLMANGDEGYNVVIDVEDPWKHDDQDNAIITLLDKFLKAHDENPIITVANTIFPQSLYLAHGAPDFYEVYLRDFDRLTDTKRWGRYFERMVRPRVGKDGNSYRPLEKIIDKLKNQKDARTPFKAAYELTLYDPDLDHKRY